MKKNILLLSVFIGLLLVLLIARWSIDQNQAKRTNVSFFPYSTEDIQSLKVFDGENSYEFTHDDVWKVDGSPAKDEEFQAALKALQDAKTSRVASQTMDNVDDFALDDSAAHIVVQADGAEFEFYLGDPDARGDSQFIRVVGDQRVIVINRNLSAYFLRGLENWKEVIDEEPTD